MFKAYKKLLKEISKTNNQQYLKIYLTDYELVEEFTISWKDLSSIINKNEMRDTSEMNYKDTYKIITKYENNFKNTLISQEIYGENEENTKKIVQILQEYSYEEKESKIFIILGVVSILLIGGLTFWIIKK